MLATLAWVVAARRSRARLGSARSRGWITGDAGRSGAAATIEDGGAAARRAHPPAPATSPTRSPGRPRGSASPAGGRGRCGSTSRPRQAARTLELLAGDAGGGRRSRPSCSATRDGARARAAPRSAERGQPARRDVLVDGELWHELPGARRAGDRAALPRATSRSCSGWRAASHREEPGDEARPVEPRRRRSRSAGASTCSWRSGSSSRSCSWPPWAVLAARARRAARRSTAGAARRRSPRTSTRSSPTTSRSLQRLALDVGRTSRTATPSR